MFLSLPTRTWIYIAAGTAVFYVAAMLWIVQDPVRRRLQVLVPLFGILTIQRVRYWNEPLAKALYYYAAFNAGIPLAFAPFRGEYVQQLKDPTIKPSKASGVERATLLIIMIAVVVAVPFLFGG